MRGFLLSAVTLWRRELVRFGRQRSRVLAALGTPLLFWLFLGSGIGSSFRLPLNPNSLDYLEYFYPGSLILVILFTSVFSSISLIEDRKEGFLLSVLVAPISRSGPILGKILGGASLAFVQGLLFLALAPLAGIGLDVFKLLQLVGMIFLLSFALTSFGFAFAWRMDSIQGFHGVMNMVLFPMWLLSGSLFPPSGASDWVQWTMWVNPLTYGVASLQGILHGPAVTGAQFPSLPASVLVVVAFAALSFFVAFQLSKRTSWQGLN